MVKISNDIRELKAYQDKINALIPKAEAAAKRRVVELGAIKETRMGVDGSPFTWDFFTQFFHEEMDRLAGRRRITQTGTV